MSFIRPVARLSLFAALLHATAASAGMQIPGRFDVTTQGSASYSIPIQVPPGIASVVPALALSYDSQAGNGLLGRGWSLDGLSVMTRCPQTRAQDGGVPGGVGYDSSDRFCFGSERLVVVNGGAYGAPGTEYRTERDAFARVVSYGTAGNGPAWFKVWTRAGQVLEFGNTADSRIEAQGKPTVRVWAMNRLQDIKSNYLTVTYAEDTANGDYAPQRIDYTGNANRSVAPNNSVQFQYASRGDVEVSYRAGSAVRSTTRLTNVRTYTGTALVTDYRVTYLPPDEGGMSQVSSVHQCDGAGTCLPATTFSWKGPGSTTLTPGAWVDTGMGVSTSMSTSVSTVLALDLNGDGKTDLVQPSIQNGTLWLVPLLSHGSGFSVGAAFNTNLAQVNHAHALLPADLNGDGKTDLAYTLRFGDLGYQHFPIISTGNGFTVGAAVSIPDHANGQRLAHELMALDVDGDGRTDLVQPYSEHGDLSVQVLLSNGSGFSPQPLTVVSSRPSLYLNGPIINLLSADHDGDGKMDLLQTWSEPNSGNLYLLPLRSTGTGFTAGTWFDTGIPLYDMNQVEPDLIDQVVPMDINGDGLSDLVVVDKYINGSMMGYTLPPAVVLTPFFSNGVQFTKGTPYNLANGWSYPSGQYSGYTFPDRVVPMDLNGDGKMDLTQVWASPDMMMMLQPVRSTGTGFVSSNWYATNQRWDTTMTYQYDSLGETVLASNGPAEVFVDFNGDGKSDMVQLKFVEDTGSLSVLGHASDGQMGSLVESMTDGLGASIQVSYKPLTDGSVYSRDSDAVYPMADVQPAHYAVASVRSSNGNGGMRTANYTYGGMKGDSSRRGWAGFRWFEVQQADTGLIHRTELRQDWPYWGMPTLTQQKLSGAGNGGVLSQTVTTYGCTDFVSSSGCVPAPGRRYFPAPSQVVQWRWDLGGAVLPPVTTTTQYDAWGNPAQVSVSAGGHVKTVVNTYLNDTANWFIGRLTRSTVTRTMP